MRRVAAEAAVSGSVNRLIWDGLTTPDGSVLTIEDAGAHEARGFYVDDSTYADHAVPADGAARTPVRALWLRTMDMHECSIFGRLVRVRVCDGTDRDGLGTPVFDGRLMIASGVLAIGDARSPDRHLLYGPPSTVRIGLFVDHAVHVLHFEDPEVGYPVSGPSDVTVLLYGDSGFGSDPFRPMAAGVDNG